MQPYCGIFHIKIRSELSFSNNFAWAMGTSKTKEEGMEPAARMRRGCFARTSQTAAMLPITEICLFKCIFFKLPQIEL